MTFRGSYFGGIFYETTEILHDPSLLLFISGILALRGIKPALFLLLAFAGLREIISAKEYQDAGEKKYAIASLSAGIFLFVFLMVILFM